MVEYIIMVFANVQLCSRSIATTIVTIVTIRSTSGTICMPVSQQKQGLTLRRKVQNYCAFGKVEFYFPRSGEEGFYFPESGKVEFYLL